MMLAAHSQTKSRIDPHVSEAARLEALDRFDVLDTPREEGFDAIVRLIRAVFHAPIGIVSVIDGHRQFYMACDGLAAGEAPRKETFCNVTIQSDQPLIIEDAAADPRFSDNPNVTGEPRLRFYAGVPLTTADGHNIGTVCVADLEPRVFGPEQVEMLQDLARLAMAQLNLRQHVDIDIGTGVLSRRAFMANGDTAVTLARRHDMELSCIAIELDTLPGPGDGAGKAPREEAVNAAAAVLRRNLRRTDIIGRIGATEFAIVLPNTGRRGAQEVADKLRGLMSAPTAFTDGALPGGAATIGAATLDTDMDDIDDLLAWAQAARAEARSDGIGSHHWRQPARPERAALRRVLKAGTIHFNNRASTMDCTVRALSGEGAMLDLSSSFGLPEQFNLMIRSDGTDRWCRIVSQSERRVEVEFL
jgi:diguanylate cyclase (GGDEF)-like protein